MILFSSLFSDKVQKAESLMIDSYRFYGAHVFESLLIWILKKEIINFSLHNIRYKK